MNRWSYTKIAIAAAMWVVVIGVLQFGQPLLRQAGIPAGQFTLDDIFILPLLSQVAFWVAMNFWASTLLMTAIAVIGAFTGGSSGNEKRKEAR